MNTYETVIGLEVHVELNTATKIFCACPTHFGGEPNTRLCPVCLGLPGALPVLNREVVRKAALAGLALGCTVNLRSGQDRKNYFYPDLPKAYQISQDRRPLCEGGRLTIPTPRGERVIGITRIHIEEDAGKLIHRDGATYIDYNRCGIPLIEIVSEPDLRSADEVRSYLQTLRTLLRAIGVSHCRMNEGTFRADINLSVRKVGDPAPGTRTEIKNLNSFAFAAGAVEYESARQIARLEAGLPVLRQTLRFETSTGRTEAMRDKEEAADYRFFPDPDLPPVILTSEELQALRDTLPELPRARAARFATSYGLSAADAATLASDPALGDYTEAVCSATEYGSLAASLILHELLKETGAEDFSCPVSPHRLASLCDLLGEGQINHATARRLLSDLCRSDFDPVRRTEEEGLSVIRDRETLRALLRSVMAENPKAVAALLAGKKNAAGPLMGQAMRQTDGRADPGLLASLLDEEIKALSSDQRPD